MLSVITSFQTKYLDQLDRLPPANWQSSAYDLFMHNDWQPWFHAFQMLDKEKLVGFGLIFHFDDVAWLGWILVHEKYRKQGIGTNMSEFLVEKSIQLGADKLILTATELGAPIYVKLGFKISSYYHFLECPKGWKSNFNKTNIRQAKKTDIDSISLLDIKATGENRKKLLENHLDSIFVYDSTKIEGFYIENLGSGLVIASNFEAGKELSDYRNRKKNKLFIVPDNNTKYLNYLIDNGCNLKYRVPRMYLGKETDWNAEMIFNRASGYCG